MVLQLVQLGNQVDLDEILSFSRWAIHSDLTDQEFNFPSQLL